VRQGNQKQLTTADSTNDIFSFPYKREEGTSRKGEEDKLSRIATKRGELSKKSH
jgi:hypothetical protein